MSQGKHSYRDLKTYHLGELGVFLRAVVTDVINTRVIDLRNQWIATHATHEALEEYIDGLRASCKEEGVSEHDKKKQAWLELKRMFS